MSGAASISNKQFKPKLYKAMGCWWCKSVGFMGVGHTPKAAWEAMHDEWQLEDVMSELTAKQRFMIRLIHGRQLARQMESHAQTIQKMREGIQG